jgi:cytochrome o ubiquinol oxidase subunit 2
MRAVPDEAFEQWVAAARQSGSALDRASYAALSEQSQNVRPFTYRTVEPNLFDAIATQELPPAPGPAAGRSEPAVRPQPEH